MNASIKAIGLNLLSVPEFATLKNTTRATVARHITGGKIIPTHVGTHQHVFIDAKKYADYKFDETKTNLRYK